MIKNTYLCNANEEEKKKERRHKKEREGMYNYMIVNKEADINIKEVCIIIILLV